jgi:capsular polysaccharide biosynthesis protein
MVLGGDYLLPAEQVPLESTSGPAMMPEGSYLPEGNLFMPRKLYLAFGGMNPNLGPNEKRFGYHEGTDLQIRIEQRNPKGSSRILARELAVYHHQKPKNPLVTAFLSGLDLGRLKGGRAQGDLFYTISRIGWLSARLFGRIISEGAGKTTCRELLRIGEIWGSFQAQKPKASTAAGPSRTRGLELKKVRVHISQSLRWMGRGIGLWTCAPTRVVGCIEEGLSKGKKPVHREAPGSYPVLPQSHPNLGESSLWVVPSWCAPLKRVAVYGPTVAVVDEQQRLLGDVSCEWGQPPEFNWTMRRVWMPSTSFLKGKALILAATGGESYYHWMIDVLPRIGLAKKNGFKLEGFDHFVVNGITKPFQQEPLQALGIPLEKCRVFGKRKKGYLCEEAVLPSMPGPMGLPPPEIVDFLRSSFSDGPKNGAELLFVGRGKGDRRPLVEAEKIWAGLQKFGFTQIEPEKMSVAEQARAFGSARVVVGAHGAGLANLAFCHPGTQIIELFSPLYVNACYRNLSLAAGLLHGGVIGNGRDWELSLSCDQASAPITASWELVKEALGMLASSPVA